MEEGILKKQNVRACNEFKLLRIRVQLQACVNIVMNPWVW